MMLTWDNYFEWLDKNLVGKLPIYECELPHPNQLITDSRLCQKSNWFLPLVGDRFDGHDFIKTIMAEKKSQGFFYQTNKKDKIPPEFLKFGIEVKDTLVALQSIAAGWRKTLKNIRIAALTGSVGKTTTKEMTFEILKKHHNCLSTQGNLNNEIGVPLTLLKLNADHQFAVIEMGARHVGDIDFLTKLVAPNVSACISIGTAHLGEFGSVENLAKTKLEIFTSAPSDTICVANADDERILTGSKKTLKKVISYGLSQHSQLHLKDVEWLSNGTMRLKVNYNGHLQTIEIGASHEAYPINALAACAICEALGISQAEVLDGLKVFKGISGRYQLIEKSSFKIIDDTYNANPDSMRAGLVSARKSFGNKNLTVILGDMLELGDTSPKLHFEIGSFVAKEIQPKKLVTVGVLSPSIADGAAKNGFDINNILSFKDVDELIKSKLFLLRNDDIVYLKASNGIKLSRMVNHLLT